MNKNTGKHSPPFLKVNFPQYFRQVFEALKLDYEVVKTDERHLFGVSIKDQKYWFDTQILPEDQTPAYYPLIESNALALARDKLSFHTLLMHEGLPSIPTFLCKNLAEASSLDIQFPVFSKPTNATLSAHCYRSDTPEALTKNLTQTFQHSEDEVIVQPYIDLPEFRVVTVKSKIIYAYRKGKPEIIGNGTDTIKTLINKFNDNVFGAKIPTNLYREIDTDKVLNLDEKMTFADITSFSSGGTVLECFDPEDIPQETHTFFKSIHQKLGPGFSVLGFDVFGPHIGNIQYIIEANANPGNFGLPTEWIYNIYRELFKLES